MKDWKEWFIENKGGAPDLADYMLAILEGPNQAYREAASRALARYYIGKDGSLSPDIGRVIPPDVTKDFSPGNPFFLEWEEKVDKYYLNKNGVYQRWLKESEPQRAQYKAETLKRKRILSVNNAYKNHPEAVVRMKDLSAKWENFDRHNLLSQAVNISMASKFMEELKKDPTLKRYLPERLVDNPGTRLSGPLYDEVRNFIKNEKEDYEGFYAIPGDFRVSSMNELRMEADRDFNLRKDPEKAKLFGAELKKKRAQLKIAREKMIAKNNSPQPSTQKQVKDNIVRE